MQNLLTNKTVSLTELRDPAKIINEAGDTPVAILKRNKLVGYFVPSSAIENLEAITVGKIDDVKSALQSTKAKRQPVVDYLKDK